MIRFVVLTLCLVMGSFAAECAGQQRRADQVSAAPAGSQTALGQSLEDLGTVVEQYIAKERALGAELLVLQKGQTLYHKSFGFADREQERPWENNTLCNIRSMTKPITSVAAQILIDRGLMNLDDPVAQYLDSFDNEKSRSITVRQVLTHRSGLPLTNLFSPYQYSSLEEQVAAAGKRGPQFEPGSKFWYSDTGTDVVGALVAQVSGELLNEFVQREIFDPIGMSNTVYGIDATDERLSRAASLYIKGAKGWTRFWQPNEKAFYPFAWGSQTVYSTTTDYAKFLAMIVNRGRVGDRQLLSTVAVDRMLEPVSRMMRLGSDNPYPTGFRDLEVHYGQMIVTHRAIGKVNEQPVVIGHSGSDGTNAWAWPDRDLMILYFTQSRGGPTALTIEKPIDRLVIHLGEEMPEETAPPELRPYLGTFVANYGGFDNELFTVRVKNGRLVLDVPSQMAYELNDPNEDGHWPFAIAPDQITVTFDRDASDKVSGLRLHKTGQIYEVPKAGTARARELSGNETGHAGQSTIWNGTLDALGTDLRLEIEITENSDGLTGELCSLDQNNARFKLTEIAIDGEVLSFSIPQIGASFSGTYLDGRASAEGTFKQGGVELPLTLSKSGSTTERAKEAVDRLY